MKKKLAILMSAVCLFAAGCSSNQGTVEVVIPDTTASAVVTPVPATPTPTPEPTPEPYNPPHTQKIADAFAKNDDVLGWISVPGTVIDQPILYNPDEMFYYQDRGLDGKENDYGSVYSHFDMNNYEAYNVSQNLVITAHNNRVTYYNGDKVNGMFHELHHVQAVNLGQRYCGYNENDRECKVELDPATLPNLSTPEGRTWDISICGIDAQWEVWAMYEVKEDEPESTLYYNVWYPVSSKADAPEDEEDVQAWINKQLERSEINFGVSVTTEDQFLTIYTCGDNHDSNDAQSRLYIFLKQVNPVSTKFSANPPAEAPAEAPAEEPAA